MFIDASALCAVLLNEADAPAFLKAMEASRGKLIISPIVRIEATLSLTRSLKDARGSVHAVDEDFDMAGQMVHELIEALGAREIHIAESVATKAIEALKMYGKITGHPAKLNFGDALSYACAKSFHASLLYKGNDFVHTDLA